MRQSYLALPLFAALLLDAAVARGQSGGDDPGYQAAYQAGRDIAELRQEVKELKALLNRLLVLDQQRVELLRAVLEGKGVSTTDLPPARAPSNPTPSPKAPTPRHTRATITGRVSAPGAAGRAYVYVDSIQGRLIKGRTVEVRQKGKQFQPRYLVVQRGTEVRFPNLDSIYHNVFSRSDNARFDLGIYRKGDPARSYVFTKPGLAEVHCNMHSNMSTDILVVPNSYFVKAGEDGRFELGGVPSGKRKITAWAPGMEPQSKWIDLSDGSASLDFTLKPAHRAQHLNKDGQPYGSYE